jgi:hypothetical protein
MFNLYVLSVMLDFKQPLKTFVIMTHVTCGGSDILFSCKAQLHAAVLKICDHLYVLNRSMLLSFSSFLQ